MKKCPYSPKICSLLLFAVIFVALYLPGCAQQNEADTSSYAASSRWAYLETDKPDQKADVFFVCPTVYQGAFGQENMPFTDEQAKASFLGAINMEKGIYDEECRFFAPYYRQVGLYVYAMASEQQKEPYLNTAYSDVKEAFDYYMSHYNQGRPLILAGFSQGADMCQRLMKEEFSNKAYRQLLVACYAIGWRITEQDIRDYPHLRVATGAEDTGVIISFTSEAVDITSSMLVPAGMKALSINPLNWRTDSIMANRELNKGACFTNYSGAITKEVPQLTGAYLDDQRGTLKVTDVNVNDYPPVLDIFEKGVYHI